MPVRTCPVCEFSTEMDEWDSLSKKHHHCMKCGLLFGEDHIAEETDGLCQYCTEEEIPYEVSLNKEDKELDMEEL